jgi:ABC-type microcin C transport system permease subunit YejE
MTSRGVRRGALALLLPVLLCAVGCASADTTKDLFTQLQYEGYNDLSIGMTSEQSTGDVVMVYARGHNAFSDEDAIESLQTVIWNSLPRRFDTLDIRVGSAQRRASYQQLSQRFGPRDLALDGQRIGTDASTVAVAAPIGVGVTIALVFALAFALRRRRRWEEREHAERLAHAAQVISTVR